MTTISSSSNTQVKRIRSLLRRKERDKSGLYLAQGTHLVIEALRTDVEIETIVFCSPLLGTNTRYVIGRAQKRNITCIEVTEEVLESISKDHTYQGIAAVVRQRWASLDSLKQSDNLCWTAINSIQCPSNLGTILRASDAVGGMGAVLIGNSTDPYYPSAVQSSLGAIFTQSIVRTTLPEFAIAARQNNYTIVGTSPYGAVDYREVAYGPGLILFMGNERIGLTEEQKSICDVLVRIPMSGRVESHNVAVATSIIMYEIRSQRDGIREACQTLK
jgi:RNA methyltransferase, TrmH family